MPAEKFENSIYQKAYCGFRHHEDFVPWEARRLQIGRMMKSGSDDGQWTDEFGWGGSVINYMFWETSGEVKNDAMFWGSEEPKKAGAWSMVIPAQAIDNSDLYPIHSFNKLDSTLLKMTLKNDDNKDTDAEDIKSQYFSSNGRYVAPGTSGILLAATDIDRQQNVFMPNFELVAHHNGDGKYNSPIYDINGAGWLDRDKNATLASVFWVKQNHRLQYCAALNFSTSPNEPSGWGFITGKSIGGTNSQLNINAYLAKERYGPICVGAKKDKHFIGKNLDEEPINSGHISINAYFSDDGEFYDAPIEFIREQYPLCGKFLIDTEVYLKYDNTVKHSHEMGMQPGLWRLHTTSPSYTAVPPVTPIKTPGGPNLIPNYTYSISPTGANIITNSDMYIFNNNFYTLPSTLGAVSLGKKGQGTTHDAAKKAAKKFGADRKLEGRTREQGQLKQDGNPGTTGRASNGVRDFCGTSQTERKTAEKKAEEKVDPLNDFPKERPRPPDNPTPKRDWEDSGKPWKPNPWGKEEPEPPREGLKPGWGAGRDTEEESKPWWLKRQSPDEIRKGAEAARKSEKAREKARKEWEEKEAERVKKLEQDEWRRNRRLSEDFWKNPDDTENSEEDKEDKEFYGIIQPQSIPLDQLEGYLQPAMYHERNIAQYISFAAGYAYTQDPNNTWIQGGTAPGLVKYLTPGEFTGDSEVVPTGDPATDGYSQIQTGFHPSVEFGWGIPDVTDADYRHSLSRDGAIFSTTGDAGSRDLDLTFYDDSTPGVARNGTFTVNGYITSTVGFHKPDNVAETFGNTIANPDYSFVFDGTRMNILDNGVTAGTYVRMTGARLELYDDTWSYNIFIGKDAGAGIHSFTQGNVGIGLNVIGGLAGTGSALCSANTAIGSNAMANATDATANEAYGTASLLKLTTGNQNCAYGLYSGSELTTENFNSTFGSESLSFVAGAQNSAFGYRALFGAGGGGVSTAHDCCAFGMWSLYYITTGHNQIGLGNYAGAYTTTQSYEVFLNNIDRGSRANDIAQSILYGVQDAAVANQHLYFNAHVHLMLDNRKLYFGNGNDYSIYFDGTDLIIKDEAVTANTSILIPLGTSTNPAIAFSGDTDNGIFKSADNILGFSQSAKLLDDKSLYFGDGNDGEITCEADGTLHIKNNTVDAFTKFQVENAGGNVEILTFDSANERVGILTTNPTVELDITGSIKATGTFDFAGYGRVGTDNALNASRLLQVGGSITPASAGFEGGKNAQLYINGNFNEIENYSCYGEYIESSFNMKNDSVIAPIIAGLRINAPQINIPPGPPPPPFTPLASVTEAATVVINNAPSEGTAKYGLLLKGTAEVYQGLDFDVSSGHLGTSNNPAWNDADVSSPIKPLGAYQFAINDYIDLGSRNLPGSYKDGEDITAYVDIITYVSEADPVTINYRLDYLLANDGESLATAPTYTVGSTTTGDIVIPTGSPAGEHIRIEFADIFTGSSNALVNALVTLKVTRITPVTPDPYIDPSQNPFVMKVGLKFKCNTIGSKEKYTKY